MRLTEQELINIEGNIYDTRARELAAAVVAELRFTGSSGLNYPILEDAIRRVAADRFRRYDEYRPPPGQGGRATAR